MTARRGWIARLDDVARAALPAVTARRATRTQAEDAARAAEDAIAIARERVADVEQQRRRGEVGHAEVSAAYAELSVALDRWCRAHNELA